jgi:low temperature requirement protein LtrA
MARWWEAPKLWRSEEEVGERKVGFLDLFYDLIFVVAIAQIAHGLAKHPEDWRVFIMLLLPLFWVWVGHAYYADRFENRELSYIFYTFLSMLPVVGMAVYAHGGNTATGFIISYALARLLQSFMWLRGAFHNEEGRRIWTTLALTFGFGASLWVLSAFFEGPVQTWLQIAGLASDLLVPTIIFKQMNKLPKFAEGRMKERYGLIMIIVLGESIAGTANGLAEIGHLSWRHAATGVLAISFAFSLYFTYFEMVPRNILRGHAYSTYARSYLHLPLILAVAATGAGVLSTVGHEGEVLATNSRYLLGIAIGIGYLNLIALSRVHEYPHTGAGRNRTEGALWVAAAISFAIAFFGDGYSSTRTLVFLSLASTIPWITGVWAWRKITKHLPMQPDDPTSGG